MRTSVARELKIPTLFGLGIIIIGIIAGVFLVIKDKTFTTKASPNLETKEISVSNISDTSATISWVTDGETTGFVNYGQVSVEENLALDDRDTTGKPSLHALHYVTIKKLKPKTEYKFKIISGSLKNGEIKTFQTTNPQTISFEKPVIGTVFDKNTPISEAIAFLNVEGALTQSALIKTKGGFLIPLNNLISIDSQEILPISPATLAKIKIIAPNGTATMSIRISQGQDLPAIRLGDNIDLTQTEPMQTPIPIEQKNELKSFDLNGDGQVNAADNSIILNNFGKNPKNKKADLNDDEVVDNKDLELLSPHINQ